MSAVFKSIYLNDATHLIHHISYISKVKDKWRYRLKKSNEMQQYADIYLFLNYSTRFRRPSRPSSGAHKNAIAASGTDHTLKYKS